MDCITVQSDIEQFLEVLPPRVSHTLREAGNLEDLIEVVLDLGRRPEARFSQSMLYLSDDPVERADLEYVTQRVSPFGDDNRAGIERTLHRISCIRNRRGDIVGLTCRVGRAIFGTIDIIRDIVETGKSMVLLGRPGIGKTTKLREIARVLADDLGRRVVVVDTSNEIGGDGDIPHPAIGRARRMQVPTPTLQHAVMIEAVENHMPEVIIIDEIGTEAEAQAARTIAERGVQLIGTAHGNTLDNLLLNPTLSDLVGGIQAVTLGDEEAKRRGTQKTVLERKAPPTFDVVVEMIDMDRLAVHHDTAKAVDELLRGYEPVVEIRYRDETGKVVREQQVVENGLARGAPAAQRELERAEAERRRTFLIYPYGISRDRIERAIRDLKLPAKITRDWKEADAIITLRAHQKRFKAKGHGAEGEPPLHVVRSNTYAQVHACLRRIFNITELSEEEQALEEARQAVAAVLRHSQPVELPPRSAPLRRLQHKMADAYQLSSKSIGRDPYRRVVIYQE